ncbi:MAG: hypothetical protein AAFU55_05570 [Pseudomonadota bacterium]
MTAHSVGMSSARRIFAFAAAFGAAALLISTHLGPAAEPTMASGAEGERPEDQGNAFTALALTWAGR